MNESPGQDKRIARPLFMADLARDGRPERGLSARVVAELADEQGFAAHQFSDEGADLPAEKPRFDIHALRHPRQRSAIGNEFFAEVQRDGQVSVIRIAVNIVFQLQVSRLSDCRGFDHKSWLRLRLSSRAVVPQFQIRSFHRSGLFGLTTRPVPPPSGLRSWEGESTPE